MNYQDLDKVTNTCTDKAPSDEVCTTLRDQFYDSETNTCVDWTTCDENKFVTLDKETNSCKNMPPSKESCEFRD